MKIICIGRNYRAHAEELHHATGLAEEGAEPIWFLKPDTAMLRNNDPFYLGKLQTARFYFAKLFPETATAMRTARTGSKVLMDTDLALA